MRKHNNDMYAGFLNFLYRRADGLYRINKFRVPAGDGFADNIGICNTDDANPLFVVFGNDVRFDVCFSKRTAVFRL